MKNLLANVLLEAIWPTRCVVCDAPGKLICENCLHRLPYLDYWNACPVCGSNGGRHLCCECNSYTNDNYEGKPVLSSCASVVRFNDESKRIVSSYKDKNEQRLSVYMAHMMARVTNPSVLKDTSFISYIPASPDAYTRRGFDHAYLLAKEFASFTHVPLMSVFSRPRAQDQRELSKTERANNMRNAFKLLNVSSLEDESVLLVDDVRTTGATLTCAAELLLEAGCKNVNAVTFARVP